MTGRHRIDNFTSWHRSVAGITSRLRIEPRIALANQMVERELASSESQSLTDVFNVARLISANAQQ